MQKKRRHKQRAPVSYDIEALKMVATIRHSMGEQPNPWNLLQPQDAPSVSNTNPKTITL